MNDEHGAWVPFFTGLADALAVYADRDRSELIDRLRSAYEKTDLTLPTLDSGDEIADIDPFTVFGLFNRGVREATKHRIVKALAQEFGITAPLPSSFEGIPTMQNMNATFYAFSSDSHREPDAIDNLWRVFMEARALADGRRTADDLVTAFDTAINQYQVKWKLTTGLHWIRPRYFVSLDSRARWFFDTDPVANSVAGPGFGEKAPLPDGVAYLQLCDRLRDAIFNGQAPWSGLPHFALAAWQAAQAENKRKSGSESADDSASASTQVTTTSRAGALGDADVAVRRYWLYSPGEGAAKWEEFRTSGVMALGWDEVGFITEFPSKKSLQETLIDLHPGAGAQTNSANALWQFAHKITLGDVVYARRGKTEILGRGIVTGEYTRDPDADSFPHMRNVEWGPAKSMPSPRPLPIKTMTEITDQHEFVEQLEAFYGDELVDDVEDSQPVADFPAYTEEDFLAEVYMEASTYESLRELLARKKNIVLQGAPGVGKTFIAKRLAYSLMGVKDTGRVHMVQFHQSYSYEDFVEGYRPNENGFELARGSFYRFCKKAADDPDNDYYFVIDEINRGNLSRIFGELFMLLEADKRGEHNKLQLLYSRESFHVPENLYVIGMMNTADRSLAMIDYALRRRFGFVTIPPGFATTGFKTFMAAFNSPELNSLVSTVEALNAEIAHDDSLGEGFRIGHSYFCSLNPKSFSLEAVRAIVEFELIPLLAEYWFDNPDQVKGWSQKLRSSLK